MARRMSRETPEINGGSMADIAFLLLIFFLVATTMDIDSGLQTKLPPMPPITDEKPPEIHDRNVFVVLLDASERLMVEGDLMRLEDLKDKTKEFLYNSNNRADLPVKEYKDVPYFGNIGCTKGIVSLQNDRGTTYGIYIKVQNQLIAAYNEVRNEMASSKFGKKYDDLDEDKQDAIKTVVPQKISEAEPKNIGGK